ncbi:hypothetical protein [Streptomyces sp. NBC_01500]|uniref:hypothetical protein n=1 Tax=Streptomyces sp. NBC_01500 TaxID=2903886 RepID=UPI002259A35F|nr:hypothetical protein [Streptomyces sp. NBC_01500]MCX4549020.1 hypothetical protein [Streptomyces sp. NBC_01500]
MRERNADAHAGTTPYTARGGTPHAAALRTTFALLALLALVFALVAPAGPAVAQGVAQGTAPASQAAHLADLLRADPVYVTDQLPREVPRSLAPSFVKYAKRTGVPTYVLVLPPQRGGVDSLLGAVHDRLGRDGLYVLVDDMGVAAATAYGVRAPADDASTVSLYELPYDAGPLLKFQRFTDVIAEGSGKAAQRAAKARKMYSGENGSSRDPGPMYIGPTDRDNQSFLTGILLTGIPLLILLLSPYVRRRLRHRAQPHEAHEAHEAHEPPRPLKTPKAPKAPTRPAGSQRPVDLAKLPKQQTGANASTTEASKTETSTTEASATETSARPPRPRRPLVPHLIEAACALLAAVAVVLVTLHTFDQKSSSAAPPPTAADLSARIDRVAAGLTQDPLYSDPESPQPLDAAKQSELRHHMAAFKASAGPVYLAVVPQLSDDESGGEADVFSSALHTKVDKDGVYIVADPLRGDIDVQNFGLRLDDSRLTFGLPDSIRYDHEASAPADLRLGARLDQLMALLDKTPRTAGSGDSSSGTGTDRAPDPVEDNALHPLFFRSDFWPGTFVGLLAGAAAFGIAVALISIGGALTARRRRATAASSMPGAFPAPADPSMSYVRRTARSEISALGREFASPPDGMSEAVRTRVWDCLDAATLLIDRDSDGRVDSGAAPAELATAVALARLGRAALATGTTADFCCALNPLHGPATQQHDVRYLVRGRRRRRRIPVCEPCRAATTGADAAPGLRRLTLPGTDGGERVAYEDATGPLSAAQQGTAPLLDAVREYAGVQ